MPPEKKKKGKRKSDALLETVESDDTASLSTLATGGEESTDPMDTVSDYKKFNPQDRLHVKSIV